MTARLRVGTAVVACLVGVIACDRAAATAPARLRVLFIGNSLTASNDLPALMRSMGRAGGIDVQYEACTPGGVNLEDYSEFGRRVRANASDGTDHGTASDVFLLGQPVRGGQYGERPDLTDLDDGDLKFTTDFRDVYASLLAGVLDTDPGRVLNGWKGSVPRLL